MIFALILGFAASLAISSLQPSRGLAQSTLLPGPSYLPTMGGPQDLVVTDLNGDMLPDLLLAGTRSGILVIHDGLGEGQFSQALPYAVSGRPFRVAVGDLDQDTRPDLVWIDEAAGTLHWTYATGDGTDRYSGGGVHLEGEEASGVLVIDLTQDGWPEVVVSVGGADQLALHFNDGAGSLGPAQFHRVGDRPGMLLEATHPQSGLPRILAAQDGALSLNTAVYDGLPPLLQQELDTGRPLWLDHILWDDDALEDVLAVAEAGSRLQVHTVQSDGSYLPRIDVATQPGSVSAVEIDRIGALRRVMVGEAGRYRLTLFEGLPGETLAARQSWFVGGAFRQVVSADIDGANGEEVLVPLPEDDLVAIFDQSGAGLVGYPSILAGTLPVEVRHVAAGAEHEAQVAVLEDFNPAIRIFEPYDGGLRESLTIPRPEPLRTVDWAYVNDDGFPDLLAIRGIEGVEIHLADGSGGFLPAQLLATGGDPLDYGHGDVDGDGHTDIAVADAAASAVRFFYGDGTGAFVEGSSVETAVPPEIVVLEDLDLDLHSDLLMLDGTIFLNIYFNDDGNFGTPVRPIVGSDPRQILLNTITPDAYPDIVVTLASGTGAYTSYLSTAPRAYSLAALAELFESGFSPASLADVSGDGSPDLILAPLGVRGVALRQGLDDGTFATEFPVTAASLVIAQDSGDVDGDGLMDVILLDGLSRCLHLMLQQPSPLVAVGATLQAIRSEDGVLLVVEGTRALDVVRQRDGRIFAPLSVSSSRYEALDRDPWPGGESYFLMDETGQELDRASVGVLPTESTVIRLSAPSPNPGRDKVQIRFRAPRGSQIQLRVVDARGRVVRRLQVAEDGAGWYRSNWQGRDSSGGKVARGRYHLDLRVDGRQLSRSLVWMGH